MPLQIRDWPEVERQAKERGFDDNKIQNLRVRFWKQVVEPSPVYREFDEEKQKRAWDNFFKMEKEGYGAKEVLAETIPGKAVGGLGGFIGEAISPEMREKVKQYIKEPSPMIPLPEDVKEKKKWVGEGITKGIEQTTQFLFQPVIQKAMKDFYEYQAEQRYVEAENLYRNGEPEEIVLAKEIEGNELLAKSKSPRIKQLSEQIPNLASVALSKYAAGILLLGGDIHTEISDRAAGDWQAAFEVLTKPVAAVIPKRYYEWIHSSPEAFAQTLAAAPLGAAEFMGLLRTQFGIQGKLEKLKILSPIARVAAEKGKKASVARAFLTGLAAFTAGSVRDVSVEAGAKYGAYYATSNILGDALVGITNKIPSKWIQGLLSVPFVQERVHDVAESMVDATAIAASQAKNPAEFVSLWATMFAAGLPVNIIEEMLVDVGPGGKHVGTIKDNEASVDIIKALQERMNKLRGVTKEGAAAIEPGKEIKADDIIREFGATKGEQTDFGFKLTLPNGQQILVKTGLPPFDEEAFARSLKDKGIDYKAASPEQQAVLRKDFTTTGAVKEVTDAEGRRLFDAELLAYFAKHEGADVATVRHEFIHAVKSLGLLTREEWSVAMEKYGDEEGFATAYAEYKPDSEPKGVFQRILDFFRNIRERLIPTPQGVLRALRSGEIVQRKPMTQEARMVAYQIDVPSRGEIRKFKRKYGGKEDLVGVTFVGPNGHIYDLGRASHGEDIDVRKMLNAGFIRTAHDKATKTQAVLELSRKPSKSQIRIILSKLRELPELNTVYIELVNENRVPMESTKIPFSQTKDIIDVLNRGGTKVYRGFKDYTPKRRGEKGPAAGIVTTDKTIEITADGQKAIDVDKLVGEVKYQVTLKAGDDTNIAVEPGAIIRKPSELLNRIGAPVDKQVVNAEEPSFKFGKELPTELVGTKSYASVKAEQMAQKILDGEARLIRTPKGDLYIQATGKGAKAIPAYRLSRITTLTNEKVKALILDMPAVYTCKNCDGCAGTCYAFGGQERFANAKLFRFSNLFVWLNHRDVFEKMVDDEINKSHFTMMRLHSSGDVFSQNYLDFVTRMVKNHPNVKFYGYTKVDKLFDFSELNKQKNWNLVESVLPDGDINYGDWNYINRKSEELGIQICPASIAAHELEKALSEAKTEDEKAKIRKTAELPENSYVCADNSYKGKGKKCARCLKAKHMLFLEHGTPRRVASEKAMNIVRDPNYWDRISYQVKRKEEVERVAPEAPAPAEGETKGLAEEAKKYKSAKEFVAKIQGSATQYGEYAPQFRMAGMGDYKNLAELGVDPEETITIYRGIDDRGGQVPRQINEGDFVTTDFDSALAYAGSAEDVVSMDVLAKNLYSDDPDGFREEPFYVGSEYVYTKQKFQPMTEQQLTDIWEAAQPAPAPEVEGLAYEVKRREPRPPSAERVLGKKKEPEAGILKRVMRESRTVEQLRRSQRVARKAHAEGVLEGRRATRREWLRQLRATRETYVEKMKSALATTRQRAGEKRANAQEIYQRKLRETRQFERDKAKVKEQLVQEIKNELLEQVRTLPAQYAKRMIAKVARVKTREQLAKAIVKVDELMAESEKKEAHQILREKLKELKGRKLRSEYQDIVDQILSAIDPHKPTEKTVASLNRLSKYITENPENTVPDYVTDQIARLSRKPISDMTIEETDAIVKLLQTAIDRSSLKTELIKAQRARETEKQINELVESLKKKGAKESISKIKGVPEPQGRLHLLATGAIKYFYGLTRMHRIARGLDSGDVGPHMRNIVRPISDAVHQEEEAVFETVNSFYEFLNEIKMDNANLTMKVETINEDLKLTPTAKIEIYMATFDEGKMEHLVENGLTENDIQDVLESMTPKEIAIGNWLLNYYENQYQSIAAVYHEATGQRLEQIPGYSPILLSFIGGKKDYRNMQEDLMSELMIRNFSRVRRQVEKGMTMARTGPRYPLKLDAIGNFIFNSFRFEHYKAMNPALTKVLSLVRNEKWREMLEGMGLSGKVVLREIDKWVEDASGTGVPQIVGDIDKLLTWMRNNAVTAMLALNTLSGFRAPVSFLHSIAYGGKESFIPHMARLMEFSVRPIKVWREAHKLFPELRIRYHSGIEREFREMAHKEFLERPTWGKVKRAKRELDEVVLFHYKVIDGATCAIAALAHYDMYLTQGYSEAEAKKRAWEAIEDTQPAAHPKDLPSLWKGNPVYKLMATFQNQVNQEWNMIASDMPQQIRRTRGVGRKMGRVVWMLIWAKILPAFILGLIGRGRLPSSKKEILEDQILYGIAPIWPFGGLIASWRFGSAGAPVALSWLSDYYYALRTKKKEKRAYYLMMGTAKLLGWPIPSVYRTVKGVIDLQNNKTDDLRRLIWTESMSKKR